jgi:hypothetical protein
MSCYYQLCTRNPDTKEHIPPKSFFPIDQRNQLLTVPSCEEHNNQKSTDDTYVLAQICMNASPSNRAREIFLESIGPQLGYNGNSLRKRLAADAQSIPGGSVAYKVDLTRFDKFFSALSYGVVHKACGEQLPRDYRTRHIFHNFRNEQETQEEGFARQALDSLYSGQPMDVMNFGSVRTLNATVYSVKLFGISGFRSSITLIHDFYGAFRVTSMLTKFMTLQSNPLDSY